MSTISSRHPINFWADEEHQVTITNDAGDSMYYAQNYDVDSGDTELAAEASVTISQPTYFISAGSSSYTASYAEPIRGPLINTSEIADNAVTAAKLNADPFTITDADGGTVDGTYGAEEAAVLSNAVTRLGEIEAYLIELGAAQPEA